MDVSTEGLSRHYDIGKAPMFEMVFVPIRRVTLPIRRVNLEKCPVLKHFSQQQPIGHLEILLCQIFTVPSVPVFFPIVGVPPVGHRRY